MGDLFFVLLPILIADAINPVLLGGTIYSLGSRRPISNTCAVLLSFLATYFLAGLLIAVGLEILADVLHIPPSFDYILELGVAVLLFYFAWKQYREGDTHPEKKLKRESRMTLFDAIILGAQINVIGLPFAIPYLAAIDQILKANLNVAATGTILLLYNIIYVAPFASLLLVRLVYRKESAPIFEQINKWMHRIYVRYMPWIFVILGILLVEDAVSYLLGYREYSFLSLI